MFSFAQENRFTSAAGSAWIGTVTLRHFERAHDFVGQSDLIEILRERGIHDARVLAAFAEVDRSSFVPRECLAEPGCDAYRDAPVPIPHGLVTTQPSLIALMVEALELTGTERVLEIGTGLGFQTAILARLCRQVDSVEIHADLSAEARRNLERAGIRNAILHVGDGTLGWPPLGGGPDARQSEAIYNGIICSAAVPRVPPPLSEQLAEGGRLVIPLGPGGHERVTLLRKERGNLRRRRELTWAYFVRMEGEFGKAV